MPLQDENPNQSNFFSGGAEDFHHVPLSIEIVRQKILPTIAKSYVEKPTTPAAVHASELATCMLLSHTTRECWHWYTSSSTWSQAGQWYKKDLLVTTLMVHLAYYLFVKTYQGVSSLSRRTISSLIVRHCSREQALEASIPHKRGVYVYAPVVQQPGGCFFGFCFLNILTRHARWFNVFVSNFPRYSCMAGWCKKPLDHRSIQVSSLSVFLCMELLLISQLLKLVLNVPINVIVNTKTANHYSLTALRYKQTMTINWAVLQLQPCCSKWR